MPTPVSTMAGMANRLVIQPPAAALAPFVEHYWLSRHNTDATYLVVPDGCIDIVLDVDGSDWRGWAYGSTTRLTEVPCEPGRHYVGIRFRPGQSRYFVDPPASELTDRRADVHDVLPFPVEAIAARVADDGVFAHIDRVLAAVLRRAAPPRANEADVMVHAIRAARGTLRIDELAVQLGRDRRRLQRVFLESVGVTAKFFATVTRATRATELLRGGGRTSLAELALQSGYADQSHMTRDLERLTGRTPARWQAAAFVQDETAAETED